MGHRRFAVISGPSLLTTTRDRLDGFTAGLAEHGIALERDAIVPGDFSREGGMRGDDAPARHAHDRDVRRSR